MTKWDQRFLALATMVAGWSKDPTTQVGAVIVSPCRRRLAVGYNGFPPGVRDDGRLQDRPMKRKITLHAELNAILNATFDLTGATLYCTHPPCVSCAAAIAASRLRRVVFMEVEMDSTWSNMDGEALLRESGKIVERV